MQIDLLGSIAITVSAAIIISTLTMGLGEDGPSRTRISGALALWFALVTAMAATGLLTYPHGLGTPGLGVAILIPMVILIGAGLSVPSLRRALRRIPLETLVAVNAVRVLGVMFVILYAAGRLPAPFAPAAGWGDILAGITAIPVAWLLHRRGSSVRPLVWIWNAYGLLDLVVAVGLGVVSAPGPTQLIIATPGTTIMTTLPWLLIPAFLVPLLACTHLAVFYRLRDTQPSLMDGTEKAAA